MLQITLKSFRKTPNSGAIIYHLPKQIIMTGRIYPDKLYS